VLKQQGHFYDMNVMAYSPDGQYIVTGGDDGKVLIMKITTNYRLQISFWQMKVQDEKVTKFVNIVKHCN